MLSVPFAGLLVCLVASAVGLAFNAVRPAGIQLVAPFPYQQDCPDKLDLPRGPTVTAAEAVRLVGAAGVLFVDARPEAAFAGGHITGARNVPFSFISPVSAEIAAVLKKKKHLIVYCDSPGDKLAGLLAEQLKERGLTAKVLRGGWNGWPGKQAGGER